MSGASERFSPDWLRAVVERWNGDTRHVCRCDEAGIQGAIDIGLETDDAVRVRLVVDGGRVAAGTSSDGDKPLWDLRATQALWERWHQHPPDALDVGTALAGRRLVARRIDVAHLSDNPHLGAALLGVLTTLCMVPALTAPGDEAMEGA